MVWHLFFFYVAFFILLSFPQSLSHTPWGEMFFFTLFPKPWAPLSLLPGIWTPFSLSFVANFTLETTDVWMDDVLPTISVFSLASPLYRHYGVKKCPPCLLCDTKVRRYSFTLSFLLWDFALPSFFSCQIFLPFFATPYASPLESFRISHPDISYKVSPGKTPPWFKGSLEISWGTTTCLTFHSSFPLSRLDFFFFPTFKLIFSNTFGGEPHRCNCFCLVSSPSPPFLNALSISFSPGFPTRRSSRDTLVGCWTPPLSGRPPLKIFQTVTYRSTPSPFQTFLPYF